MVAFVEPEIDGGGIDLAFEGMDHEEEGCFVGLFLFAGEELDVNLLGVVVILGRVLVGSSGRA